MPTYEYKCDACEHAFEEFQSIKAPPTRKCPKCKKLKVRRLISAGAGLLFKGSGFYITDYRTDSYKSGEKAAEGSSSSSSANTDSKPAGDSKPAADAKPASDKPASGSSDSSSKPAAAPAQSESKAPAKKGDSKKG